MSFFDDGIRSPFSFFLHVIIVKRHLGRERSPPVMFRSFRHEERMLVADWRSCLWVVFVGGVYRIVLSSTYPMMWWLNVMELVISENVKPGEKDRNACINTSIVLCQEGPLAPLPCPEPPSFKDGEFFYGLF